MYFQDYLKSKSQTPLVFQDIEYLLQLLIRTLVDKGLAIICKAWDLNQW